MDIAGHERHTADHSSRRHKGVSNRPGQNAFLEQFAPNTRFKYYGAPAAFRRGISFGAGAKSPGGSG